MPRALISAGHTVMDPGQIFGDLREADLTRKIAPKVIPHLQAAGVEVQGVPLDLPLLQRVEWINNTGYTKEANDVLVEIHVNDGGKRGIEAWFEGEGGNNSQKLAKVVVDTVCGETGYQNQGIHAEHEHELRSLTFLNRSKPAALLLELLYIDNPEDIAILKEDAKLEELAKAVAKGILKYFGKDLQGKDLPEDQKPKYDDLKPVPRPAPAPGTGLDGFGMDDLDDDIFADGLSMPGMPPIPAPATKPSLPTPPAVPAPGSTAGFSTPGIGAGGFSPPMSTPGAFGAPKPGGNNFMMDREQRREMIKKNYVKILGREPSQSDMNYFLNQGTSEQDLVQKMIDSQEHQDLVKAKKEAEEMKKKVGELEAELTKVKAEAKDNSAITQNLQNLLAHKNRAIQELEQAVFNTHGVPSSVALNQSTKESSSQGDTSDKAQPHQTFLKKFYVTLSRWLNK
ncbi:MAG: N-acetylmuramoyl-L-alanine amidase [Candidatus Doudnabacteria bacterium]|nr:N-acetylmuramoyl-L-alanine amidase [Candidatus Doudnabacteria bacterium]